jgi:hypothetical protein
MAVPTKDNLLANWSTNFNSKINSTPLVFGLTITLATAYGTLHSAYLSAHAAASVRGTRSQMLVSAKNAAKQSLLANARDLYQIVQGTPTITDAQRDELGIRVRKTEPTRTPPPASAPALIVKSVSGWTARVQLRDSTDSVRRGKPAGSTGAAVFSFAGATAGGPPADIAGWKFEGNTGKTAIDVQFDTTLAAGARVWMTAMWFNGAKQSGPACAPVSANLPGGSVAMAA